MIHNREVTQMISVQLARRHDAGAGALAHFPHHGDTGRDLPQLCELPLHLRRHGHAELGREPTVALLDRAQLLLRRLPDRGIEQSSQLVGDARKRRVNNQYPRTGRLALGCDAGNVPPVGEAGNARAAELQDHPGRGRTGHCSLRPCGRVQRIGRGRRSPAVAPALTIGAPRGRRVLAGPPRNFASC